MQVFGIDLSKNHFGFCHISETGKTTLRYVYFKEYLQKEQKQNLGRYAKVQERVIDNDKFLFEKIRFSYDNKNYNQIQMDALKSQLNLSLLEDYIAIVDGPKFVVLEDYVMQGERIVQLVHVGESFKYQFANKEKWKSVILYLCPSVSWKAATWSKLKLPPGHKLDAYEKIDMALKDDETYQYIKSLQEREDVTKDLIDSYGLARMHRYYSEVFLATNSKRIFVF